MRGKIQAHELEAPLDPDGHARPFLIVEDRLMADDGPQRLDDRGEIVYGRDRGQPHPPYPSSVLFRFREAAIANLGDRKPPVNRSLKLDKRGFLAVIVASLAITGTAAAQWTPQKPGDPRTCGANHTATECAAAAASFAFRAKYVRVTGHAFANTLHCSQAGTVLSYMCVWGSPARQTPVRFAHKAAGWKVAVGVIPVP